MSTAQRMTELAGARLEAQADRGEVVLAQLLAHVGLGHRSLTFSTAIGPSPGPAAGA